MQLKCLDFKAENVDVKKRTFTGYASTWDLDQGGDIIVKGAFAKTLKEAGGRVKILWQHYDPIGRPVSMEEDNKGLLVEGYISETRLGDEALTLMNDGVIDRMSIGYMIPEGKSEYNSDGIRVIREIILKEFSLVTFPMNEAAIITGVKSVRDAMSRKQHFAPSEINELSNMVSELTALLKGTEPPAGTQSKGQPQDLEALASAIENWGI